MSLSRLLTDATPGPWEYDANAVGDDCEWVACTDGTAKGYPAGEVWSHSETVTVDGQRPANARLIALCPETTKLLVDMAALIEKMIYDTPGWSGPRVWWADESDALLARFALLEEKAGAPKAQPLNQRAQALGSAEATTGQRPEQENTP